MLERHLQSVSRPRLPLTRPYQPSPRPQGPDREPSYPRPTCRGRALPGWPQAQAQGPEEETPSPWAETQQEGTRDERPVPSAA